MEIISRNKAIELGLKTYFTGMPCIHGHIAEKRTDTQSCVECRRNVSRLKRLSHGKTPWSKSEDEKKLRRKLTLIKYCKNNPHKIIESQLKYKKNHPERRKETCRKWAQNNKHISRIQSHTRRSRKLLSGGILSKGLFDKLFQLQKGKCACCNISLSKVKPHLDHINPLSKGGSNTDHNIQLLCQKCNLQKNAKHPIDFMQSRGFLI